MHTESVKIMTLHVFKVVMTCDGCKNAVQKVLDKQKANGKSIDDVEINLEEQTVKISSGLSHEELLEMIKKTGKTVEYVSST